MIGRRGATSPVLLAEMHARPQNEPVGLIGSAIPRTKSVESKVVGRAQQLAERAVEIMQSASSLNEYEDAEQLCLSAIELDPGCLLADGMLHHVRSAKLQLKGDADEKGGRGKKKSGVINLGRKVGKVGKAGGKGLAGKSLAAKHLADGAVGGGKKRLEKWIQSRAGGFFQEVTLVGTVTVHVDRAAQLMPHKHGFGVSALVGLSPQQSTQVRDGLAGAPSWAEKLTLTVEEVTDTIQILVHRGEYKDSEKSLSSQCVGQVLIPVTALEPLKKPTSETKQTKSRLRFEELQCATPPGEQLRKIYEKHAEKTATARASASSAAARDGGSRTERRRGSLDSAPPDPTNRELVSAPEVGKQPRSILGRKSTRFGSTRSKHADLLGATDERGIVAGGIAQSEVEQWAHVMGKAEYKREKKKTKERRTRTLATDANNDLFRGLVGGGMGGSGLTADDVMSVKSAPGAMGAVSRRDKKERERRDEITSEWDAASMASMPVSVPSSRSKKRGARSIRFEGDAMSEASGFSAVSSASTLSSAESAQSAGSDDTLSDSVDEGAALSGSGVEPASGELGDEPEPESEPCAQDGPPDDAAQEADGGSEWHWYEIFPFCKVNSDGTFRQAHRGAQTKYFLYGAPKNHDHYGLSIFCMDKH
jgi:hypothetical protein